MTTSPSLPLSLRTVSQPTGHHHDQDELEVVTDQVREAIAGAAAVGERAAAWAEALAGRQDDTGHQRVLEMFAAAVRHVLGREILPAGDGEITGELRYALDAYVVLGATSPETAPDLTTAEQLALVAVGAVAATAPSTVLNDLARDLPALCSVIESALILAEA